MFLNTKSVNKSSLNNSELNIYTNTKISGKYL